VIDSGHDAIDKFNASGLYEGQITEAQPGSPFGQLDGVAVDPAGTLWVYEASGQIDSFSDGLTNAFTSKLSSPYEASPGFAVDSEDNLYVNRGTNRFAKLNSSGDTLEEEVDGEASAAAAVEPASDEVYIDNVSTIGAFSAEESPIERFGAGHLSGGSGVAVNASNGTVYVANSTADTVAVFAEIVLPDVSTGAVSSQTETTATVVGSVDPDNVPITSCIVEYGTSDTYGESVPCTANPGSGAAPVAVSATLTGLQRGISYHYRLVAGNASGTNSGEDRTFAHGASIAEESITDVSSSDAAFNAQVNPDGLDTTFRFEYGTSESYGASVPVSPGDLGAGTSAVPVSLRVQSLQPQTTYHMRLAVTNALGAVYGPDETFTTQAVGGELTLPDGRQWEMVSPPAKDGATIEPPKVGMVEAAEGGSAITYDASGPVTENPAGNPSPVQVTQLISRRGAGGVWSTEDIATPRETPTTNTEGEYSNSEYVFFSSNLSRALVEPVDGTLSLPEISERTLYVRNNDTGGYIPLVTSGNVPAGTKFGKRSTAYFGTPDLSHMLFKSENALTSNAFVTAPTPGGVENIYEWADGRLTLVNVLPNGAATPNGGNIGFRDEGMRNAISSDGSRVFWMQSTTGEPPNPLYMSDTATGETVQVDAPEPGVSAGPLASEFQIASVTGSKVFFLDGEPLTKASKLTPPPPGFEPGAPDLYVYDTEAKTLTDLSVDRNGSEVANVQEDVVGASEDGSIVYFVATGVLAEGAEPGKDNLYVESETGSSWSEPRLIAVLSKEDSPVWGQSGFFFSPAGLAAKVSPNGRFLAFMSARSLTGYDNRDASSGHSDEEVFLYDEATGHLACVSCDPTGARPAGVFEAHNGELLADDNGVWAEGVGAPWDHWLAADIPAWDVVNETPKYLASYQWRYLTNDGRLFFNSFDSLVAQDTNGRADVYEYEPSGVGSCTPSSPTLDERSGGCVSLISSGTSPEESVFLDASGKGPSGEEAEDVFFLTASRLTSQDYDSSFDVYDAHSCSSAVPCVSAPVTPPACASADACKAAPSLQPAIFGAPASATLSGGGNPQPSPLVVVPKKETKKTVKHRQKGKKKRKRSRKRGAKRSTARGSRVKRLGVGNGKGR
jgi:hypothetical protein